MKTDSSKSRKALVAENEARRPAGRVAVKRGTTNIDNKTVAEKPEQGSARASAAEGASKQVISLNEGDYRARHRNRRQPGSQLLRNERCGRSTRGHQQCSRPKATAQRRDQAGQ